MGVRLVNRREEVVAALRQRLAAGLNEAAQYFVDEAQANANVDTGFMISHIGQTVPATSATLFAEVRSLAPYSGPQDTGRYGNLFWTRAWLATKAKFPDFFYAKGGSAGRGVIGAAQQEFEHGVTGQGLTVTRHRAFGSGGLLMRNKKTGRFAGVYGSRRRGA